MLSNAMVSATLPAIDIKRARKFYEEKLGLKVLAEDPTPGILLQAGHGSMLYIYQREPTERDHTLAAFYVENLEEEMNNLRYRGIEFEDYEFPGTGIKTVNGIAEMNWMKGAWFMDSEGNRLAIGDWSVAKMKKAMSQRVGASTTS